MKINIYGLKCPIENTVFYVGQTKYNITLRLKRHLRETIKKIKSKKKLTIKEKYIQYLIEKGLISEITVILLEYCDFSKRNIIEKKYISKFENLTNMTKGGSGFPVLVGVNHPNYGMKRKKKTKKLISKANSGVLNGMYGKRFKKSKKQIEKARLNMINSEKFQKSRKSKKFKNKISNIQSIPLILLDEKMNYIREFSNTKTCLIYLKCSRSNVKKAVQYSRKIGRGLKTKYWVIRKSEYEKSK